MLPWLNHESLVNRPRVFAGNSRDIFNAFYITAVQSLYIPVYLAVAAAPIQYIKQISAQYMFEAVYKQRPYEYLWLFMSLHPLVLINDSECCVMEIPSHCTIDITA